MSARASVKSSWLALTLIVLMCGCANDPAIAPITRRATVDVELGLVAGDLSAPAAVASRVECPAVEGGFPEAVDIVVTVTPETGSVIRHEVSVPARTPTAAISVDGLTPGAGYVFGVDVTSNLSGEQLFVGTLENQTIRPGSRDVIRVPLSPVGRRGVIAIGTPMSTEGDEVIVPVLVSNALALRGVQFELCFDDTMLDVVGVRGVGRVAEFDGISGGRPVPESPYRVVVWSTDDSVRLTPGGDAVVELTIRFDAGAASGAIEALVFGEAILAETTDPSQNFETYFFDGSVTR